MLKRTVALMLCILSVFTLLPAFSSAQTLSGWTSKVDYDNTDPNKYSIEIDLVNQIITVRGADRRPHSAAKPLHHRRCGASDGSGHV